ncbi:transcription activator protein [Cajanus scarabaeoides yellow mosaic virus]|uniref:Transcriptional activator protein n=1 Tax=Cajanus scarabaeoides yellow mosaic virus TaxID=3000307 RepID=A0A9E8MGV0_9GEMI|nr:transcription activator protein [Cajanus scarabaeoides yellow mosaic virus]
MNQITHSSKRGLSRMRSSTPSKNHCSPPSIKAQHRFAKKKQRAIRRRRIDLPCGCSFYAHIDCHKYGFTHRGTHHCLSSEQWRLYLGNNKSPIFQGPHPRVTVGHYNDEPNGGTNNVQPPAEESVGDAQVFPGLDDIPSFQDDFWADLDNI